MSDWKDENKHETVEPYEKELQNCCDDMEEAMRQAVSVNVISILDNSIASIRRFIANHHGKPNK